MKEFYELLGVKQHNEFEKRINELVFNKDEREEFYKGLLKINNDVSQDIFKPYFEEYAAERKTFKQDYTPDSICKIVSIITRSDADKNIKYSGYDPTAGTGSMLIQKWWDDMMCENIFSYAPHRYLYRADEIANNVIPYLIHNMALRGMNCIVVHGDVLNKTAKNIYLIQNAKDNFLGFSEINVFPRTEEVEKEFGIEIWEDDPITYKESGVVIARYALPMKRKALKGCPENFINSVKKDIDTIPDNAITLQDVANVERVKKNKIYKKGTVIVQISATNGQVGLLTSDGKVGTQYAAIEFKKNITGEYGFYYMKLHAPRWIHRIKEGLNIRVEELAKMPFSYPV